MEEDYNKVVCCSYSSHRRHIRNMITSSWQQMQSSNRDSDQSDVLLAVAADDNSSSYLLEMEADDPEQAVSADATHFSYETASDSDNTADDTYFDEEVFVNVDTDRESDSCAEDDDADDTTPINTKIAEWYCCHNITHEALADLLGILRPYHPGLPVDPRTLVKTPRSYVLRNFAHGGSYYHFGIASGIKALYSSVNLPENLKLQFNFDGLPLFKSSACELWPILCRVKDMFVEPFVVGLYCGIKKPQSLDEYLEDFVGELQNLMKNGMSCGGRNFVVTIDCFVCDAPARAFVKNVKSFSGYHGCEKCVDEGEYVQNRMTFQNSSAALRSDVHFDELVDDEHHRGTTPLRSLNFGLVTGFVLDYMHLVCLGVMRKLLCYWMRGPLHKGGTVASRLPSSVVNSMSEKLISFCKAVPREFARKPRSLTELDRWKATEFRAFLLYFGPVILSDFLSETVFSHFMLLSASIRILASPHFCGKFNNYAHQLLVSFVEQAKEIYGPEFIVYNVHSLIHLPADVQRFGPLDAFSAFPFENQLKSLKRLVRKTSQPLPQIIRRVTEMRHFSLRGISRNYSGNCFVSCEHNGGPLPAGYELAEQFMKLRISGTFLSLLRADNCIATLDHGPLLVKNILRIDGEILLMCKAFRNSSDLFTYPFPSSSIGVVLVSQLCSEYTVISAHAQYCKCAQLDVSSVPRKQYAVFPLVHNQM